MKITIIVGREHLGQIPWVLGASAEFMGHQHLQEAIRENRKENPLADIRTGEIEVPESFLQSIFEPVKVVGMPVERKES